MYKQNRNYENVNKQLFDGVGEYEIPSIKPTQYENCEFIGFNFSKSEKNRINKGIHFFLDDYQFQRLWTYIDRYIPMLQQVMSPDFSLYMDFPKALQIYNHYRKHWIAVYMQEHGIDVIPTIGWSDRSSFEWCFDGEPGGGCVAISSVGCMNSEKKKRIFLDGYNEMRKRLEPETILFYGEVPEECKGNIICIDSFHKRYGAL